MDNRDITRLEQIAKLIDHSLLHPALTDQDIESGCELALGYNVASVCLKPYSIRRAKAVLGMSSVLVGGVVGFPAGNSKIEVKVKEGEVSLDDGADELDVVVNIGKVLSGDYGYVTDEIESLNSLVKSRGAVLKVIFETDYLNYDSKIRLCQICSEIGVDYVKTSTGFGFSKDKTGFYSYRGATAEDVSLMRQHCNKEIKIKAAGGIRSLDQLLLFYRIGADRIGATATKSILEEALARFGK
ncbi:MAG: deoxyribose-phosphate aldolase [Candidatus Omnitrophica bacterium]|nr:deoxyribose-phosphate aldolase [Candidatus Omnitrophota bacterium]